MSKIKLSTANGRKLNKHYIPSVTLTTSDVGTLQPVNIVECHVGDHISVNMNQYSQTQPTAVRTFGSFNLKTWAFFVPFKSVWKHYQDWMVHSADTSIPHSSAPTFSLMKFMEMIGLSFNSSRGWIFHDTAFGKAVEYDPNIDWSSIQADENMRTDFGLHRYIPASLNEAPYMGFNLNATGRLLMKVMRGLGYEIPSRFEFSDRFSEPPTFFQTQKYSLLPLISFARIFYDYIYPSGYVQQQGFGSLFEKDDWDNFSISKLVSLFFVPMEQDFFTNLWIKPNSKALGSHALDIDGQHSFQDTIYNTGKLNLFESNEGSFLTQEANSQRVTLSAASLRWLESMSDYVIRNSIGGTRFHEWMKAHFGYVTKEQDCGRSVFLKSFSSSLNFSPVTAMTGTDAQLLGQMAGNGSSQSSGKLKFEAGEDGYLIFLHMVTPSVAYYQGIKPWCKPVTTPFDFYTPELDGVDMEPISRSEVYNSYDSFEATHKVDPNNYDNAFGFAPRYADRYKRGASFLNGDFRLGSRNADMSAYHTFRDVLYNRQNLALDAQFMQADNQYNRVFAYPLLNNKGESARDHIESLFTFDITRYSTASTIGDSMPIFNRSGRDVSISNGGTQLS